MPVDRDDIAENNATRARLAALVAHLSDEDLGRSLGDGWTVSAVLAHLTFWDRRALLLLQRWAVSGVTPSPADPAAINDAALPQWLALPPRLVAQQVVGVAEAVDRQLELLKADVIEAILAVESPISLARGPHRGEHLDQIEQTLR